MSAQVLEALRTAIAFEPQGERVANLSWGRGTLDGRPVHLALVENRFASGAMGTQEAERLGALFKVAALGRTPLVLFLDSAGAKVSEGLKALGAFRAIYRAALDAAGRGAPLAAVLGNNCYGGSSVLAHFAPRRLHSPNTQLAMSGPAILAAAAGMSAVDEMFRAMAQATFAAPARAKAAPANTVWEPGMDVAAWLRAALADAGSPADRHAALATRIANASAGAREAVQRKDLERIYDGGYRAEEASGLLSGAGRRGTGDETFIGLVGRQPVGAARAWHFADLVWKHAASPPRHLEIYLDCASHAARLDDERIVLSEYIAGMASALGALAARGTRIGLTVLGEAGGAVYATLAAPAQRVRAVHGAEIQVLPGNAVAAILGASNDAVPGFDDYRAAGVADEELKLGILPP